MPKISLKDENMLATFGERLRYLREEKGLKQTELAKLLNLESSSTISQYENEVLNRIPDAHILQRLADIFNVTTDFILARTNVRTYPHIQAAHIDEEGPPVTEDALNQLEKIIKREREKIRREKEGK